MASSKFQTDLIGNQDQRNELFNFEHTILCTHVCGRLVSSLLHVLVKYSILEYTFALL